MTDYERSLASEWVDLFLLWLDTPYSQRASIDARMSAIDEVLGLR